MYPVYYKISLSAIATWWLRHYPLRCPRHQHRSGQLSVLTSFGVHAAPKSWSKYTTDICNIYETPKISSQSLFYQVFFLGTFHNMFQTWHTFYLWLHMYQWLLFSKLPQTNKINLHLNQFYEKLGIPTKNLTL